MCDENKIKNILRNVQLELFAYFDKVCLENNFSYSMNYGTLLGAIRHEGFIPWDDDLDVMMPSKDYEAFLSYCSSHLPPEMELLHRSIYKNAPIPHAQLMMKGTEAILPWDKELSVPHCIYIDIYPIYPFNDEKTAIATNRKALRWLSIKQKHYLKINNPLFKKGFLPFVRSIVSKMIPGSLIEHKLNKIESTALKGRGNYWLDIYVYPRPMVFHEDPFQKLLRKPFSGTFCNVPANYDYILTTEYGNYMELPPPEQRVGHHFYERVSDNRQ